VASLAKKTRIAFWAIALAILVLGVLIAAGSFYAAAPLSAKIVDSATGEPVEGANIVASWNFEGGLEGGSITGHAMVMEAVSDQNGEFRFRAWGPHLAFRWGAIKGAAPELLIFKSGYRYLSLRNAGYRRFAPPFMHSDLDHTVITLAPFIGSFEDYARDTSTINEKLSSLLYNDECKWRAIPKFLLAIDRENKIFIAKGSKYRLYSLDYLRDGDGRQRVCGDLKAFVERNGT